MRIIKLCLRALAIVLLVGMVVLTGAGAYLYYYKEKIVQDLTAKALQKLQIQLEVPKIRIKFRWATRSLGIAATDLVGRRPAQLGPGFEVRAKEVFCSFRPLALLNGQYRISRLRLVQGHITVIFPSDQSPSIASQAGTSPVNFSLRQLNLKDMTLVIQHAGEPPMHMLQVHTLEAKVQVRGEEIQATLKGYTTLQQLTFQGRKYAEGMDLKVKAEGSYDMQSQELTLAPSELGHNHADFIVQGTYQAGSHPSLQIRLQGADVSLAEVWSLLPVGVAPFKRETSPGGLVSVDATIQGPLGASKGPAVNGQISLKEVRLPLTALRSPLLIEQAIGTLHIPDVHGLSTASLSLKNIRSTLGRSNIGGDLHVHNFDQPYCKGRLEGTLDLPSLSPLLQSENLSALTGQVATNFSFEGPLAAFQRNVIGKGLQHLEGDLHLQGVGGVFYKMYRCQSLTGAWHIKGQRLSTEGFSGLCNKNDFWVSGTWDNFLRALNDFRQPSVLRAKLRCHLLDLNAMPAFPSRTSNIALPAWDTSIDCEIGALQWRRFQGKHFKGTLSIKDGFAIVENLHFVAVGGQVQVRARLDVRDKTPALQARGKLKNLRVNELFYACEDFHQDFVTHKHLEGTLFSDFELSLQLDPMGKARWNSLEGRAEVLVKEGRLVQFPALQHLKKYMNEKDVVDLQFKEIKNMIRVQDRTIHIPPMEIHSSATHLRVSGTHTFDHKISYEFVLPLRTNFKRKDTDSAFGTVIEQALSGINLFLKLRGTTDDYQVTYRFADSLKEGLKQQKEELKEIFQGKKREKMAKELNPDEYFEFD